MLNGWTDACTPGILPRQTGRQTVDNVCPINFTTCTHSRSKKSMEDICGLVCLFYFLRQNEEGRMNHVNITNHSLKVVWNPPISENSKHSRARGSQSAIGQSGLRGQRKWANCIFHSHIPSQQIPSIISVPVK